VGFGSSDRLAGAYGTGVSTTMLLTTVLLYHVMRAGWGWWPPAALAVRRALIWGGFHRCPHNLTNIRGGGWIPLAVGGLVFGTMITWRQGMDALQAQHDTAAISPENFFKTLRKLKMPRVPGTAVFLTRLAGATPPLMVRHVEQIGALQES